MNKKQRSRRAVKKPTQLDLFGEDGRVVRLFGGALLKGNAKVRRPLSTSEAIHLVLKSEMAIGPRSMLNRRNVDRVNVLVRRRAKLGGIKIFHFVNVGNHLHLVIKIHDRKCFAKFIRTISGLIARHVMEAERGKEADSEKPSLPKQRKTKFWVARPFTRLIAWGKDYKYVVRYMAKNHDQASKRRQKAFAAWGFDVTEPDQVKFLNTG